ncbi:hypothetical protein MVEG_03752 [Podila verticillata NRRL 6337]|nr:hypothetical protein MVEG_03752 [Podila verticillata NRRL 6337]
MTVPAHAPRRSTRIAHNASLQGHSYFTTAIAQPPTFIPDPFPGYTLLLEAVFASELIYEDSDVCEFWRSAPVQRFALWLANPGIYPKLHNPHNNPIAIRKIFAQKLKAHFIGICPDKRLRNGRGLYHAEDHASVLFLYALELRKQEEEAGIAEADSERRMRYICPLFREFQEVGMKAHVSPIHAIPPFRIPVPHIPLALRAQITNPSSAAPFLSMQVDGYLATPEPSLAGESLRSEELTDDITEVDCKSEPETLFTDHQVLEEDPQERVRNWVMRGANKN